MPLSRREWNVTEDADRSHSRLTREWYAGPSLNWEMEVRTENLGAGTMRLGELSITGMMTGELKLSIKTMEAWLLK